MSPVGDVHFYAKKTVPNRCRNGGVLGGVFVVLDYGVVWCFSILAPSAPIYLHSSSFLRRSIAEMQNCRSVQKRAPTDE